MAFRVDKTGAGDAAISWAAPQLAGACPAPQPEGRVSVSELASVSIRGDASGGRGAVPLLTLRVAPAHLAAATRRAGGLAVIEVLPVDDSEGARKSLKSFASELSSLHAAAQMAALSSGSAGSDGGDAVHGFAGKGLAPAALPFPPLPAQSKLQSALPYPAMGVGGSALDVSSVSSAGSSVTVSASDVVYPPPPASKPTAGGVFARGPTPPMPPQVAAQAGTGPGGLVRTGSTGSSALRSALEARGLSLPGAKFAELTARR